MTTPARLPGLCHLDSFIITQQLLPIKKDPQRNKLMTFSIPPRQITNVEIYETVQ